jgi:hypothetical protein
MKTEKRKRQPKRKPVQRRPAVPLEDDDRDLDTPDLSLPDPHQLPDFIRRPLQLPAAV